VWSHGDDAAFLSSAYGLAPDDWQFDVLEAWLGVTRSGRWSAGRCGLAVSRQNGKNALIEMIELYKMVALGRCVLHTAHEVKTARKAFQRLCGFFENERQWPELAALVKEVRRTNGQEAVVLHSGASCEFVARSRGSARGYTVDDLVLDEAQELTDEQLEALLPTISAAPSGDPQVVMTGTPPGPNSPGDVFARTRAAGLTGQDRRLSWHEWSADGTADVTDRAVWAATNPSLGIRLNVSVIVDEAAQMSPDGFARERLGVWASDLATKVPSVISPAEWAATVTDDPPFDGLVAFGVKFSPSGSMVALSAALKPDVGPVHVEGIEHRSMVTGTGWLVGWLADRWESAATIVVDGRAGAGAFVAELRDAGVPARRVTVPTTEQVVTAHAMLLSAVTGRDVTHLDDPAVAASIGSAGRRKIGNIGGWGFESVDGGDVTLAESVVLAHFGAVTARRRPRPSSTGQTRRAVVA
jgi:hypothetical protein